MEFAWAKAMYEAIGVPYPMLSQIGVMVLGALLLGVPWFVLGQQHQKEQSRVVSEVKTAPIQSTQNVMNSSNSPSVQVTGNNNNIVVNNATTDKKQTAMDNASEIGPAAIFVGGGSTVQLYGNRISGYSTAIRTQDEANVFGQGNVIEKGDQPKQFPPSTGEFKSLSNSDLCERVKSFATTMRAFESKADVETSALLMQRQPTATPQESKKLWEEMNAKLKDSQNAKNDEFQKLFRPQATSLASELLLRIEKVEELSDSSDSSIWLGRNVLTHGMLAGQHPMSAAADFLEYMAGKLPQ
jgi:hypothetical protein